MLNLQTFVSDYLPVVLDGKKFTQSDLNEAIHLVQPEAKLVPSAFDSNLHFVEFNGAVITLEGVCVVELSATPFPAREAPPTYLVKMAAALMVKLGVIDNIKKSIQLVNLSRSLPCGSN
ncbi:MAG: hypothetical protein IBX55_12015 [Methyloprofundus sp.]|nr:hypothetical protein [Methyloprofundus sp.]